MASGKVYLVLLFIVGTAFGLFVHPPYLQNLTDSTITVVWQSAESNIGKVRYGLNTNYPLEISETAPTTAHHLVLNQLLPDTVYHYQVISGPDTTADATFFTRRSAPAPFRFLVYADNRTDSAAHQAVIDRMVLTSPPAQFVLNAGDLTDNGTVEEYRTFFQIEQALLRQAPLYPVLGNHDIRTLPNWFDNFFLPGNERWYHFQYSNAAFYFLDNYSDFAPGSEQYEWLLAHLLADSANPTIRHIFVTFHEPPFTTSSNHSNNEQVQEYLCPLFERFRVRAVFNGHVHAYEHSLVNGIHYITSGGGGAPLHTEWDSIQPYTVYREANYQFVIVDVAGDLVTCEVVRADGSIMETFNLIPGIGEDGNTSRLTTNLTAFLSSPNQICLKFHLKKASPIKLALFDPLGREQILLKQNWLASGEHRIHLNARNLTAGTYFALLQTPEDVHTARLTLLK
ncbi:hypothetical protein HPY86_05045 [candidate division WOR-3 bacterium]|nr:hypothetical protein [candidate division WOR-3 bacterium]